MEREPRYVANILRTNKQLTVLSALNFPSVEKAYAHESVIVGL